MKASLFAIAVLLATSVASTNAWKVGSGGSVLWDFNCNFLGNEIDRQETSGEDCGGTCVANLRCTHFTWRDGTCFLKRFTRSSWNENAEAGPVCGFVRGRSMQSENPRENNLG